MNIPPIGSTRSSAQTPITATAIPLCNSDAGAVAPAIRPPMRPTSASHAGITLPGDRVHVSADHLMKREC
ncbi:hypothetical protein GCM10027610_070830 [Dactylosporangium cerinum]